ncbi:MAG: glycosyltransferase family 4 protein [Patescibacteria group bacterium]|nr:glycosyltransferase family 4 protein [Patescibacteria group bacterium]
MKILFASTLKRRIASDVTASRSRIIYELASGMVKKGHEVSLLGTGDSSISSVTVIPVIPKAFVDLLPFENPFYAETSFLVQLAKKIEEVAGRFDMIHNHTYPEVINLLASEKIDTPMVTTIHAQATEEFDDVLSLFKDSNLISISKAHRNNFKKTTFRKVIYNGVDTDLYAISNQKREYLLWIGRLSKAKNKDGTFMDPKGIKWAIQLARETGEKLILSGNVEDMEFYEKEVKPFLNDKIEWAGPVSSEQALKKEEVANLMQGAKAFLMTINWDEPFGLVMAEAQSSGTPVIGFNRGSVPELIVDGKTGFVVDPKEGVEGLKNALSKINSINYEDCRKHVLQNFSLEKMVENYGNLYNEVLTHQI